MNFTAIDFETANAHHTSACSIGLARVEDGEVKEVLHRYIKPYPNFFNEGNVEIHGITRNDTKNAPAFPQVFEELRPYIEGQIVVAHFAPFDVRVLLESLEHYGEVVPEFDILCSCMLSQAAYPELESHRLNAVCESLDIPLDHHRADSDALGSALIVQRILDEHQFADLSDIRKKFSLAPGYYKGNLYKPMRRVCAGEGKYLSCPSPELLEKDFAFTGSVLDLNRKKIFDIVSCGGGHAHETVTRSCDYLVVGKKNRLPRMSKKEYVARKMQKNGHPIQIITADRFESMLTDELKQKFFNGKQPEEEQKRAEKPQSKTSVPRAPQTAFSKKAPVKKSSLKED